MKINEAGLQLIRQYEGFSPTPYLCPAGIWTIGYGRTQGVYKNTPRITVEKALSYLKADVADAEFIVKKHVTVPLNINQFSALVSFVYNVGAGREGQKDGFVTLRNGEPSSLLKCLNRKDYDAAAFQFTRWIYGGGEKLPGLVARREAEQKLFKTPVED